MQTRYSGILRLWRCGLTLALCGAASTVARAQSNPKAPTVSPAPDRMTSPGPAGLPLEWIFFPATPPPLGAEVAVIAASRPSGTPRLLRAFVTDAFYPQLASRLVRMPGEQSRKDVFEVEEHVRLDAFLGLRAALVAELYERAPRFLELEPEPRLVAFETFAQSQARRLEEMERTAEWLRERMARTDSWSEHRSWRLNRGSLRTPRDKTYVLEFQVVRAAAYYQVGLSPAQRRLVRECAMEMNETIALRGRAPPSDVLFYFSPDTTRILRPEGAPPELDAAIAEYIAEKTRLKAELRELIYETDGALFEATRIKRFEELAAAQAGALSDLEVQAESIRRQLVRLSDYRRFRRPPPLDARVEERLREFAERAQAIDQDRAEFVRERMQRMRPEAAPSPQPQAMQETAARARAVFEMEQGSRLIAHERDAEVLLDELVQSLPPDEAGRLNGSPDVALRDYLERRAEQDAYAEYDLAVLEPGLSPAQRRLLLASAMARLRQVELPPELQPTDPPGELLGLGQ